MKPPYAIGSVPSLSGHAIAYRWRSLPRVRRHRASKPQGSSERVLPWQITMDQLIFASLSHTHYWYEVGMLKVAYREKPTVIVFFFRLTYCIADEPQHCQPACGHQGSSHLSPVHAFRILIAIKVQHPCDSSTIG